jgi:hypothetical protein
MTATLRSVAAVEPVHRLNGSTPEPFLPRTAATVLAVALAAVAGTASAATLLDPAVLHGPAAMNGSARGTALVVLFAGVPLLVGSVLAARRGSALARLTWLGALGLFAYNALMFLFATPFNELFPLYVAWLGLAAWSIGSLLAAMDVGDLAARFAPSAPRRAVASYIWVVVALNALAWLAKLVPGLGRARNPEFLRGTGTTTSIVLVEDLGLWLPLMAVVGLWLWRGQPWGLVLAAAGLVMWVLESVCVAVDQAYGAAADPGSPVVSVALTPVFLALAAVGVVPVLLLLAGFDAEGLTAKAARLAPAPLRRGVPAWSLAAVAAGVAASAGWGGIALVRDGYGMPVSWLDGTPFTAWTWPGIVLLAGVAVPHGVLVALVALGSRWARLAGLVCGGLLVVWIVVQLVVLQQVFFLQPVVAALGAAELLLARRWR